MKQIFGIILIILALLPVCGYGQADIIQSSPHAADIIAFAPLVDVRAYGAEGTKVAIDAALATIGPAHRTLYLAPATWLIHDDLTIPDNVNLKLERGAILSIDDTKTLTIKGTIDAGPYRIFSWTGTGKAVLGPRSIREAYPEWWGAKADYNESTGEGTDNVRFINAAIKSVAGTKIQVALTGDYKVMDQVLIGDGVSNTDLVLTGRGVARLVQYKSNACIVYARNSPNRVTVQNLILWNRGGGKSGSCLLFEGDATNCVAENVTAIDSPNEGILAGNSLNADMNMVIRCIATRCNGIGIGGSGKRLWIADCIAKHNSFNGIDVNAESPTIVGNYCEHNGDNFSIVDPTARNGIYVGEANKETIVSNNKCIKNGNSLQLANGGLGIVIGTTEKRVQKRVIISNNICSENVRGGIQVSNITNYVISGNVCADNGYSLLDAWAWWEILAGGSNGTILGNSIHEARGRGINITGNNINCSHNVITSASVGASHAIDVVGKYNIISENIVEGIWEWGIVMQYPGADCNRFSGNVLKGFFKSGPYYENPATLGTIRDIVWKVEYDLPAILNGGYLKWQPEGPLGAILGDQVQVIAPYDLQGLIITVYIRENNRADVIFCNQTGTTVDLGSGTWTFLVIRTSIPMTYP